GPAAFAHVLAHRTSHRRRATIVPPREAPVGAAARTGTHPCPPVPRPPRGGAARRIGGPPRGLPGDVGARGYRRHMRILHTSDWHLGRTLHGVDLVAHQAAFLDHLVEVVRRERVDAVLVAGDVYDRAIPPVAVVDLLDDVLLRLTEHTRVVLTPGNHDSATRLGFGAAMF